VLSERKGLKSFILSVVVMKRGRKKIEKDETDGKYPESEESGAKTGESDDSGSFKATSEMIGGNPNGINAIRALQIIPGGSPLFS